MQPHALLAVTTFKPARTGILSSERIRERVQSRGGLRLFELAQISGKTDAGRIRGLQTAARRLRRNLRRAQARLTSTRLFQKLRTGRRSESFRAGVASGQSPVARLIQRADGERHLRGVSVTAQKSPL